MVPDKFNMVDMEGIDIVTSQGEEIPGLYQKLVESIAQCRYQCIYNWKFDGIIIPPTYVEMTIIDGVVWINEGVSVDEEDVITIFEPDPVLTNLSVTSNGIYTPPEGVDGFNYVDVSVPISNAPVAEATITSFTETGANRSFDVTLSRPITKGVVQFFADATTEAAIYADTSTLYYVVSLFALYPVEFLDTGTVSTLKCGNLTAYRGSSATFAIRVISSTVAFDIMLNGTTMTVQWAAGLANFFPDGAYKVKVWEIADS